VLTVIHHWWFVRRPNRQESIDKVNARHDAQKCKLAGRSPKAIRGILVKSASSDNRTPDLNRAKEHMRESSPTDKDNNWRSIWDTSIKEIGLLGGPGLGLYFTLLVYLGLCFSYSFIFSIPLTVFTVLGDFAPEGSGAFPQLSIANLGTESTPGVAQENRLVVMGCQGMQLSELTKYFGWLDFMGNALFTWCAFWLCFRKVPETERDLDEAAIQASDYALEMDQLPERLDNDHENYKTHLERHLVERVQEARRNQARFYTGKTPPVEICDIVLVRDRSMKLGKQKLMAQLGQQKDIEEFKGNTDKIGKIQTKIDKISQSISVLGNEEDLPVLRAFVTFNASDDVVALLHQYRFARFYVLRQMQTERLRFQGTPIRVKRAPEPSNIFWENQDAPWRSRFFRKLLVWFICVVIVLCCLGLMYATAKQAQEFVKKYETTSTPGAATCNSDGTRSAPPPPICTPTGWDVVDESGSWVLVDAMGVRLADQTQAIMDCFCSQKGVANILQDPNLRNACNDLIMAYGLRLAITILAALFVVIVNVCMAGFLMVIAEWELPLSISELNNTQMMTVFISQTLNTACVVFAVHYDSINDFQRGWYVVVGVAVCTTMAGNTVVNAACYFAIWGVAVLKRMCTSVGNKHQAELLQIYTNPPWDMASRYAYLLMTVYVTVFYSSGMPILNFLAILYCFFSYWSDKIVLLWGSALPPQFDAKMPKRASWWFIYSGALHCLAAIAMYGHPCVFPSNPLGGSLGTLTNAALTTTRNAVQAGADAQTKLSGMADTFVQRWGRDCTWMFAVMLFVMVCLCALYIILKVIGSTLGEAIAMVRACMCPSRVKVVPEGQSSLPWAAAAVTVEAERPPASYRMEEHPDFKSLAQYMHFKSSTDLG